MRRIRVAHSLSALIALLICLAPSLSGQVASDPRVEARQLAGAADDNAISLEERQEALRKLEAATRAFLSVDETIEAARTLNRAGRLQLILNAPQDALASHSKALDILKQMPDAQAEVDALNGLGAAYIPLDGGGEAEAALRKSLSLSEQSGYTPGQAQALLTLSEQQVSSDRIKALETAQKALALWQTLDDKRGIARSYAQVGQYYMAQNALPESEQNYRQALAIWRDLNNPAEQAGILIMLGFIEFRRGEWADCISFLTQAQGMIDERADPRGMGQISSALAEAFNENGMPENGLVQHQRALDYYRRTNNAHLVAMATWGIGATHYLLKNYSEAIANLNQVLAGLEEGDSLQAQCYEYLGRVYLSTDQYDLARQNLSSALDLYTRAGNPLEAAQVRGLLGQLSENLGQPGRAREYYKQALAAFTKLSHAVNQAAVYFALGRLEMKNGDYEAAKDYLRQSIDVMENLRRVPASSDLTAAFSATVHERYATYIECLMREHRAQPSQRLDARAFEISESARGRSLAELLRATSTNLMPGLDPKLAEQEKQIRQTLRVKEDYKMALLRGAYKKEELDAVAAELARLEAQYQQVMEPIKARYPSYEQMTRPVSWDLRRIQEQVVADDQTVLVEYSLGADRSYAWVVTRDDIKSYELPAQRLITEAAQKVYNLLATRPGSDDAGQLTSGAHELATMILSPFAAELRHRRRVIVVADGALNYIPFQVLPASTADGEPFVADYEVVNAPSASILGGLRQEAARRRPAPKVLAAFGNPVFASDYALRKETGGASLLAVQTVEAARWRSALRDIELNGDSFDPSVIKPLFYARRELSNLREVAGGEVFVAEDFAATRDQLLDADLTQYAILHFATHGLLDPKHPENSGMVLSTVGSDGHERNGFVGLQDIYAIRAPVDLVVLSACRTALGKDVRGEGLLGLTRGFMYAGASSVVASLWKVDDEATAELMKQFYTNLLQKRMPPAAALRAAQNSIRERPEWRSPFYWAAFTLQGEYRQIISPAPAKSSPRLYWLVGVCVIGLALTTVGVWWYRRRSWRAA